MRFFFLRKYVTMGTSFFSMNQDEILKTIDDLVDQGTSCGIKALHLDPSLSDQIHKNVMAWRALTLAIADIQIDGLEAYRRHEERKME